jgi:hypothetical protein
MEETPTDGYLTDPKKCYTRTVWCGTGGVPTEPRNNAYYTRQGSSYECLKKGFGTGMHEERRKGLPPSSLLRIMYVTEAQEHNFVVKHITTQQDLIRFASLAKTNKLRRFLSKCLVTKSGGLDQRAYNSVVLFLYTAGVAPVPDCH